MRFGRSLGMDRFAFYVPKGFEFPGVDSGNLGEKPPKMPKNAIFAKNTKNPEIPKTPKTRFAIISTPKIGGGGYEKTHFFLDP